MGKKFKLTGKTKTAYGRTLHQIEALISFGEVKVGDLGGWLENENSLSQKGTAWVFEAGIVFKRGEIHGGEIWGGVIWGGEIWGGEIWGGEIHGGEIWGGEIWGGEIHGGVIHGGEIHGGVIHGGVIHGGTTTTKTVVAILGLKWGITITDKHISIGCQTHTFKFWKTANDATIEKMEHGALSWWKENRGFILKLVEEHENKGN